jgi:hypothetical protein
MATIESIYTKQQTEDIINNINRALADQDASVTVFATIAGAGLNAGAGWALGELGLGGIAAIPALIPAVCEVKGNEITRDVRAVFEEAFAILNADNSIYDRVKLQTTYSQLYIPAKRGWPGGNVDVYVNTPEVLAYHTGNGWQYV